MTRPPGGPPYKKESGANFGTCKGVLLLEVLQQEISLSTF